MISLAHAQTAGAATDPTGGLMQLLPMILMFVILWFLMIRPQMKKAKEHKSLIAALDLGDEVVTQGGILGKIAKKVKVEDNYVTIRIASVEVEKGSEPKDVEIIVQKPSISLVLPKGTLKSL